MTANVARVEPVYAPWAMVLFEGIAALVIGVLLIAAPAQTMFILVQLLGIYWLITGVLALASIFLDQSQWGWKALSGAIGVFAGIAVIQHPLWSAVLVPTVLVIMVAVFGIMIGAVNLFQAFRGAGWGAGILGVLSIIFGLILLASPLMAAVVLPWVLGFWGIVSGIAAIAYALRVRPIEQRAATAATAPPTTQRPEERAA
ncbi:MAG: HdeD family acid-resistance protein [Chloroflexi bacterium]|nr:HdeD family acid-resistance protein [Chloroflexota bacterium]